MADFETRALIQVVVGYQTCLYTTLVNNGGYNNQPLFIISFLLFTASLIIVTMQKFEILKDNVILLVCAIVMLFISGLFSIIGIIVWNAEYSLSLPPYQGVLNCASAAMAIIGGIFLIMKLMKKGGAGSKSKTTPENGKEQY